MKIACNHDGKLFRIEDGTITAFEWEGPEPPPNLRVIRVDNDWLVVTAHDERIANLTSRWDARNFVRRFK